MEKLFNGQENPDNPVWKKVYYIFLFLKVNQCTFQQKERNNFKARKPPQEQVKIHQIKNRLGCFTLNPLRAFWLSVEFSLRL